MNIVTLNKNLIFLYLLSFIIPLSFSLTAQGYTAELIFLTQGEILPVPQWQDTNGAVISSLDFVFQGSTSPQNFLDVESTKVFAKLQHALNYPANIFLTMPSECYIGSQAISNQHVQLLMDGQTLQSWFNIPNNTIHEFLMRFHGSGLYSNIPGSIRCLKSGQFLYSH